MGVRVLAGDQTGYAYVEGVTMEEMLRAARTAARIASSGKAGKSVGLTEKTIAKSRYAVTEPWEDVSVKAKIPYLEKLNEKIFSLDNRVRKVQASLSDSTSHVLFCNSEGVSYYTTVRWFLLWQSASWKRMERWRTVMPVVLTARVLNS